MAKIEVQLTTRTDYVIAGVALAVILLALLFTANSVRTAV